MKAENWIFRNWLIPIVLSLYDIIENLNFNIQFYWNFLLIDFSAIPLFYFHTWIKKLSTFRFNFLLISFNFFCEDLLEKIFAVIKWTRVGCFNEKIVIFFSRLFILGRGKKTENHQSWVCVSATATTVVFLILWAVIKRVNIIKGLGLTCLWMLLRVKNCGKIFFFLLSNFCEGVADYDFFREIFGIKFFGPSSFSM